MRVGVLQHVPFEGLGSIGPWLQERGAEVGVCRLFAGDALPELADFDVLIAMGGPMSVNDDAQYPWLREEKRLAARAIAAGKGMLGICLGAQLMANAMGARVYPNAQKEIGWFPVFGEGGETAPFAFPDAFTAFHWHGETFDLPPGAVRLAHSRACLNQAFRWGQRAVALQFHLETTPESADAILMHCRDELVDGMAGVQTETAIRAAPTADYRTINALMTGVLENLCHG